MRQEWAPITTCIVYPTSLDGKEPLLYTGSTRNSEFLSVILCWESLNCAQDLTILLSITAVPLED
jgi:hypothetical protein